MKNIYNIVRKRLLIVLILLAVLVVGACAYITVDGTLKIKEFYYAHKAGTSLAHENLLLQNPLRKLGFTDIKHGNNTNCSDFSLYMIPGSPIDRIQCMAEIQSYKVFDNEADKQKAINAAREISTLLEQNGWKRGNYELGKWFKDVLNKVDYNPDAFHYKYVDKKFCVIDFYVAYSNPKPPAVQAMFNCSTPESNPPLY